MADWFDDVLNDPFGYDEPDQPAAPAPDQAEAPAPATDYSAYTGGTPTAVPAPLADQTITPLAGDDTATPAGGVTKLAGDDGKSGALSGLADWAEKNKTLAAALATTLAGLVGGVGKGIGDRMNLERKAELDRETLDKVARDKTARTAQNVNTGALPFSPGNQTLLRPDGTPVYSAKRGIINRSA